ncbi:MAG: peptidoglycan DD-metalloendopeptidase family protein [candidate division WOR-3 bacterium]
MRLLFITISAPGLAQELGIPLADSLSLMQRQLEATKQRLSELEQKLTDLKTREKNILEKLDTYNEQITLIKRYITQLTAQINIRSREVMKVTTDIAATRQQIQLRREQLTQRLINVYKYARILPLQVVFSTKTLPELWRRVLYLRWIARSDRKILCELRELNTQLSRQQEELMAARAELERTIQEYRLQEEQLSSAQAREAALLQRVRNERAANDSIRTELLAASQNLQRLVAELTDRRAQQQTGTHYFERNKGKLPWPIRGKVIAGFGSQINPKYGTRTNNLGIDIKPSGSSTVAAIAPGTIVYADRFLGYGNLVIIDHGAGYYTLYGNLDTITAAIEQPTETGTAIGICNEYLHFEIRKDGQPQDPLSWLAQ